MKAITVLVPLAIGLVALLGFAYRSVADARHATENEVLIRPGENSCVLQSVEGPETTEVRQLVLPELDLDGPNATTTANARRALLERHGWRVAESSIPMRYEWRWNPIPEKWELVCTGVSQVGEHLTGPAPHGS